jgi:hypothetical protein
LTTFRCRRAQTLQLAEKTPDYSIVCILQTRRPIENGAANVWEKDPRQALVKTAHLVFARIGHKLTCLCGPFHRSKHLATAAFRC